MLRGKNVVYIFNKLVCLKVNMHCIFNFSFIMEADIYIGKSTWDTKNVSLNLRWNCEKIFYFVIKFRFFQGKKFNVSCVRFSSLVYFWPYSFAYYLPQLHTSYHVWIHLQSKDSNTPNQQYFMFLMKTLNVASGEKILEWKLRLKLPQTFSVWDWNFYDNLR